MSVSVLITNLSVSPVNLSEMYVSLGAAGSANASITTDRSVAQLDSMNGLKALVDAGTISVVPTQSSNNVDLLSIPLEQHGTALLVDVSAAVEVTTAVVFAEPFPAGVVPVVTGMVDKTNGPLSRSVLYVENVTNVGFDLKLDVTTLEAASTVDINWAAVY